MANQELRNLETIPVGSLGIIALKGCEKMAEKIDSYLSNGAPSAKASIKKALLLPVT